MPTGEFWPWIIFNAVVLVLLATDLVLFHRRPRSMSMREALGWSAFWVALALGFTGFVGWFYNTHFDPAAAAMAAQVPDSQKTLGELTGRMAALNYLAGYVIELSLSVDNLFVFLAIFNYFGVRGHLQHRVLFWGIVAAIALRGGLIFAGVALIEQFHWTMYIMGAFLVLTGGKLAFQSEEADPANNLVLRITRRWLPMAPPGDYGQKFLVRQDRRWLATPLMLVLIVVNVTDVIFAVDSIPAVLAITHDPFLAYTSNFLAILGLRAMYFALARMMGLFAYLKYGLAAVLVFVGAKMIAEKWVPISIGISLGVVGGLLGLSVIASILFPPKDIDSRHSTHDHQQP